MSTLDVGQDEGIGFLFEGAVIPGDACGRAAQVVRAMVEALYIGPGKPPPPKDAVDLLRLLNSAVSRRDGRIAQVSAAADRHAVRGLPLPPGSGEKPVQTLSTERAAATAGVCARTVRRMIDRGDVEASRDHRGALRVHADSLAAWVDGVGRKDRRSRKAA